MKFSCILIKILFIKCACSVTVDCEFKKLASDYECNVKSLEITSKEDRTITEVLGSHLDGKSNDDVTLFQSSRNSKSIKYFPKNLKEFFPNLNAIIIMHGKLEEINSDDLKPFGDKLKFLSLEMNSIKILPSGLFDSNPNLEEIQLSMNEISLVENEVFDNLEKLNALDFHWNKCALHYGWTNMRAEVLKLIKLIQASCRD